MQVVLATSMVAETKRLQFWRDAVCDTFVELDCRAVSEASFFGEITTAQCDEMHFSRVRSEGQIVNRTKSRIRNAREEIVLVSVQTRGRGIVGGLTVLGRAGPEPGCPGRTGAVPVAFAPPSNAGGKGGRIRSAARFHHVRQ